MICIPKKFPQVPPVLCLWFRRLSWINCSTGCCERDASSSVIWNSTWKAPIFANRNRNGDSGSLGYLPGPCGWDLRYCRHHQHNSLCQPLDCQPFFSSFNLAAHSSLRVKWVNQPDSYGKMVGSGTPFSPWTDRHCAAEFFFPARVFVLSFSQSVCQVCYCCLHHPHARIPVKKKLP